MNAPSTTITTIAENIEVRDSRWGCALVVTINGEDCFAENVPPNRADCVSIGKRLHRAELRARRNEPGRCWLFE